MILTTFNRLLIIFLLILGNFAYGNDKKEIPPFDIAYFKDATNLLTITKIYNKNFTHHSNQDVLNLGVDDATFWIRLSTKKDLILNKKILFIEQGRVKSYEMYSIKLGKKPQLIMPFVTLGHDNLKNVHGISYLLPDTIKKGEVFYLKLKSYENFIAKIYIVTQNEIVDNNALRDIFFGIYTGVMLIMFIYNLFLFIVVRDKSYIHYVFYILFTWLTQISIQGYGKIYIWDNIPILNTISVVLYSLLGLLFAGLFTISFLNTKVFVPKVHKIFQVYMTLVLLNIACVFLFDNLTAFKIMQILIIFGVVLALSTSYYVYFKKHFKPAGYYSIAWTILLIGAVLFILKDFGLLPYNNFTIYLMQITSAIEVTLLSFALADKINFFKKENEIAQAQALNASLENQKLIREQNVILEKKVEERTEELQSANSTLNVTLTNLKNTQSQLVDAEKMAALGQLTAGIAHEINNPINFVTSNIKPLELDINDLKEIITKYENLDFDKDLKDQLADIESFKSQIDLKFVNNEITTLLAGISEGAKRTAEIIRSLRNFSRLDESDMKPIDLNEGLQSTLVLVKNSMPDNLTVVRDLGNLPQVECQPGKINQVFMNLVSNAIQAIKSKEIQADEEFLTIRSWYEEQQVKISIKDTGTGMTEETKHRIFEPFFTTKDIGEGTGLGLSIVFSIIESHKGQIEVISKVNVGTEFIITLNVNT
ncbi:7TM diverse intracellular signaling domain-containing protein [Pedobacter sp. Du54]|uniref:7TM diverse intracellular signaling domain-containing protein n=1 Tax=Pedobacter anseongensis TaxID=3133439 RepID=UPI00309D4EE6